MEKRRSSRLVTPLKSCFFVGLTVMAFNANACCSDAMYLGNPNRPDTVWQPPHCNGNGCWAGGSYKKFVCRQSTCHDVCWQCGRYDGCGNWIPAHFNVPRYVWVNPGPENRYPGFPM